MKLSRVELRILDNAELALRNIFNLKIVTENLPDFLKQTEQKLEEKEQLVTLETAFNLLIDLLAKYPDSISIKRPKLLETYSYIKSEPYAALCFYASHLFLFEIIELLKTISSHKNSINPSLKTVPANLINEANHRKN